MEERVYIVLVFYPSATLGPAQNMCKSTAGADW